MSSLGIEMNALPPEKEFRKRVFDCLWVVVIGCSLSRTISKAEGKEVRAFLWNITKDLGKHFGSLGLNLVTLESIYPLTMCMLCAYRSL